MISIIVPIYNSEKWLSRCVESLINQTYKDIEILLVNDGSTDKSLEICKEYEKKDSRITVIDKENGGVSSSRNAGIDAAKGEYIQFVDSDDFIEPQMCEMFANSINDVDMVICGMRIYEQGRILREPHLESAIYDIRDSIDIYFGLRKINLGPCNKLYRKSLITQQFKEGISLGEDTIFLLDYMKNVARVAVISECLYNVVLDNENSLNKKKFLNRLDLLLEQRKTEEETLIYIYGNSCDLTQLYNQYLSNTHAYFLLIARAYKSELKAMIKKYVNRDILQEKIRKSSPARWDLNIFRTLFLKKLTILLWFYFKIKSIYYGN